MIPEQCPRVAGSPALKDISQALKETIPVLIVPEDGAAFNASGNDVMKSPRSVYAGFTRHALLIAKILRVVNLYFNVRPPILFFSLGIR